jgi:GTP pyrophosphokinase
MVKLRHDEPRFVDGRFDADAWVERLHAADRRIDRDLLRRGFDLVERRRGEDDDVLLSGIEFADLMAELRMDSASIVSGLVYRCVRAGHATIADLEQQLDADVAHLVADVERVGTVSLLELTNTPLLSREARDQVDNVRRMLVAMIDDVRVAIIKLAERIIALRTVKSEQPSRQLRVAKEALEVFAPLANRLGIWRLKWELEDLAFRYQNPDEYRRIASRLDGKRIDREEDVTSVGSVLAAALAQEGIEAEVRGRAKHIYSIWRKMDAKHIDFDQVYDIRALRVVVSSIRDCYAALGVIHTRWRHVPREFDDYIANPKDNGYRSIHTAVVGPDQRTVEIQIRTREMHREAELGVCAHWAYKNEAGKHDAFYAEKLSWLRQVLEWHEEIGGFVSVGRELRSNIEGGRIYVLTPAGHVLDMPEGSTPVDVAYRVHTQIGQRCVGARVDGEEVALNVRLSTGQRVEIITDERAQPSRDWLDQNLGYVRTARALAKIQSWFRSLERAQNVAAGRTMLLEEFDRLAIPVDLPSVAAQVGYADVDALCFAVAVGERQLLDVIAALARAIEPAAIGRVVHIDVASVDRAGILHDITGVLGQLDISMVSIQATSDEKGNTATIRLGVEIRDLLELATLLDRIRRVTGVTQVKRQIEAD